MNNPLISIILPCRNEEESIGQCIIDIQKILQENNIDGEIIVSDSSHDNSPVIATSLGVTLVKHDLNGYGNAYLEGFKAARGKYLFLADSDGSYDFSEIVNFLKYLVDYDFVIGNRLKGKIEKGSMPFLHRYLGTPILSFIFSVIHKQKIKDINCGMRGISTVALTKLCLKSRGMEFASEMMVEAVKNNLKIKQLPINYKKRKGTSKLKTFSDGYRHLSYLICSSIK